MRGPEYTIENGVSPETRFPSPFSLKKVTMERRGRTFVYTKRRISSSRSPTSQQLYVTDGVFCTRGKTTPLVSDLSTPLNVSDLS